MNFYVISISLHVLINYYLHLALWFMTTTSQSIDAATITHLSIRNIAHAPMNGFKG